MENVLKIVAIVAFSSVALFVVGLGIASILKAVSNFLDNSDRDKLGF